MRRYLGTSLCCKKADIIYLGQAFDKYGNMLADEEKCIEKLFSLVDDSETILIKPHPRDSLGKYDTVVEKFSNVQVFQNELAQLPIECLLGALNTRILLSFNSSAGVNIANTFPNIRSVFLLKADIFKPIHKYWNKIGAIYDDSIYSSKNNNTFLPENDMQIIELLKINSSDCYENPDEVKIKFEELEFVFDSADFK